MPTSRPAISVVSPVYGCRGCLEELVDRVHAAISATGRDFEIVLVDDASPDGAWERIRELADLHGYVRGLRLARNFGQHYAISAGIEAARGDIVVVMDCDLQDVPEEIPRLIGALNLDDGVEIAFAQRAERRDTWSKRLGSWAFYQLLSWLTGVRQDHSTANFGAFSRRVIDTVNALPERERFFPLMVKWTGFGSVSVPVEHASRAEGRSSYSLGRLLRLAVGVVLTYSDKPLRLIVKLGLGLSLVAFAVAALSIVRFLHGDVQVAGFTSIIASIWLLGGATIFCMGVLGLYLGRVFMDSKGRPYYLIAETTATSRDHAA